MIQGINQHLTVDVNLLVFVYLPLNFIMLTTSLRIPGSMDKFPAHVLRVERPIVNIIYLKKLLASINYKLHYYMITFDLYLIVINIIIFRPGNGYFSLSLK